MPKKPPLVLYRETKMTRDKLFFFFFFFKIHTHTSPNLAAHSLNLYGTNIELYLHLKIDPQNNFFIYLKN